MISTLRLQTESGIIDTELFVRVGKAFWHYQSIEYSSVPSGIKFT